MNLTKIEQLYSDNIKKFGRDPKSVGWGTKEKQDLRFSKLLNVVDVKGESFSVNELGCGYGELVKYCKFNSLNLNDYYGYDISKEMLKEAKQYLMDYKNVSFYNESKLETTADYSIASGIFNVCFDTSEQDWEKYCKDTLVQMFDCSKKGISFNLLTSFVDYKESNLFYADPMMFFDFCKKNLSKNVSLLHDYPLWEWTILARK